MGKTSCSWIWQLLDMTPKAWATKEKIDNWASSKLKTCISKDIINKVKKIHVEKEMIFTNHIFDSGPVSRIYFSKTLTKIN